MVNSPMRVVLVEDQTPFAEELRVLIDRQPGFTYIATAASVKEALILLPLVSPDLVLMDVELRDGNAFDIIQALDPIPFKLVFVTAFKQYALKAIQAEALDYLIKPVVEAELIRALERVRKQRPIRDGDIQLAKEVFLDPLTSRRIALKSSPVVKLVDLEEIIFLESNDGGTTFSLTSSRTVRVQKAIKDYEDLLPKEMFFRIHHAFLVNTRHVDAVYPDNYLVLKNGTQLPIAVRRKEALLKFLTGTHKR